MKTYLIVRIQGLKQHFLTKNDYERIVREGLNYIPPEYADVLNREMNYDEAIKAVIAKLVERMNYISKICKKYEEFTKAFLLRLECENIKAKVKALAGFEPKITTLIPIEQYTSLEGIKQIKSMEELIEYISRTPLKIDYEALQSLLGSKLKYYHIEALLDSAYYDYFKGVVKKAFKRSVLKIVDKEGLLCLAYWWAVMPEDISVLMKASLLRGLQPRLLLRKSKEIESLNDILAYLDIKSVDVLTRMIEEGDITAFLERIHSSYVKYLEKEYLRDKYADTSIYFYAYMCYLEAINLVKIFTSQKMLLSPETILGMLLLP